MTSPARNRIVPPTLVAEGVMDEGRTTPTRWRIVVVGVWSDREKRWVVQYEVSNETDALDQPRWRGATEPEREVILYQLVLDKLVSAELKSKLLAGRAS